MKFTLTVLSLLLMLIGCGGSKESDGVQSDHETPQNTSADIAVTPHGEGYIPSPGTSWQYQLSGSVNTRYNAEIYDIDLFDTVDSTMQALAEAEQKVICYFSAGSFEDWRDDAAQFEPADYGKALDGWPGEYWLDIRREGVRTVMQKRLDLAVERGCVGVEPDNMDGYANDTGFDLTADDQLDYNRFIATEARDRGLAVGLKNTLELIPALVDHFDFAVNEQCVEYDECDLLSPFIEAGKAVLTVEYRLKYRDDPSELASLCAAAESRQFSTVMLPLALDDSFRVSCL